MPEVDWVAFDRADAAQIAEAGSLRVGGVGLVATKLVLVDPDVVS